MGGHDTVTTPPLLSFSRGDPERRLGLPAGRYTQANQLVCTLLAIVATSLFYVFLFRMSPSPFRDSFVRGATRNSLPLVPPAIVLFSMWAAFIILFKWLKLRFQRGALGISVVPRDPTFVLSPSTVDQVTQRLFEAADDPRHFVLFNRIQLALSNLRNMRRIGDVRDVLDSQAEHDEAMSESSYLLLRGIIWAIPVLGFIGTVLGLAAAIGKFSVVLAGSSDIAALRPALQEVTGGLGTAFETTLQGLVAALAIHMVLTVLKRSEEGFLDQCKEYCQRHIVGCLRLNPSERD